MSTKKKKEDETQASTPAPKEPQGPVNIDKARKARREIIEKRKAERLPELAKKEVEE